MSPPAASSIFIVDDHPVFREGLSHILDGESDLNLCGVADSAEAALRALPKAKPDLVLVDIGLPGMSGLELIKEIRALNQTVKLLVVSMHDEALYVDRVLNAGGDGYIMKQENPDEIVHAIRDVLGGHIYVSEEVLADKTGSKKRTAPKPKARPLDQLADSELEVLQALGQGKSSREISRDLGLSVPTVEANAKKIRRKLHLKTANALIRYAVCWVESGVTRINSFV
jgi:DNA-binding NarL/FixJ family response regulator